MTKIDYEIRPMKDDRPVITFPDREGALNWLDRRSQSTGWDVRMRLVKVEKTITETVEHV